MPHVQSFDESPTASHWSLTAPYGALSYDDVLEAAAELPSSDGKRRELERAPPAYYAELLFILTHRRCDPCEAERTWRSILSHREELTARLGRNPGIAVAALDYLANVEHALSRPTLIERPKLSRLVDSATRDPLTGLFRRGMLAPAIAGALAEDTEALAVIMLDLDHFKELNDRHGHLAGDRVLSSVGEVLRDNLRTGDVAVRYGGEEFCVVLPGRSSCEAEQVAERLRVAIAVGLAEHGVTASVGVAAARAGDDGDTLVQRADEALYASKRAGRNRVTSRPAAP